MTNVEQGDDWEDARMTDFSASLFENPHRMASGDDRRYVSVKIGSWCNEESDLMISFPIDSGVHVVSVIKDAVGICVGCIEHGHNLMYCCNSLREFFNKGEYSSSINQFLPETSEFASVDVVSKG